MKKAIVTFGLFSIMMILTSFTTPNEISGTQNAPDVRSFGISGTQNAPDVRSFGISGTQNAPDVRNFGISGTQNAPDVRR